MLDPIGLIAAMSQESQALLRRVKGSKRLKVGNLPAFTFDVAGHAYVMVTSGMGLKRAREAAQTLVEMCAPHLLISFGIAGAVEADLEIGDVVLPEAFCQLDKGSPGELLPLSAWSETAFESIKRVLAENHRRVYRGTAITTSGSQATQGQLGGIPHPVLEMETAGIAQAADEHDLPLLCLRSISDGPRNPIPLDLTQVMDKEANLVAGKMLKSVLRNPAVVFQAGRIMRNVDIAASSAAVSLLAALRMPELTLLEG